MKKQTKKEIDKKLIIGKIAKITWGDAHGGHDLDFQDTFDLMEIHCYGRIVNVTKETVAIAAFDSIESIIETIDDFRNRFRYICVIPRKCIWRVRFI